MAHIVKKLIKVALGILSILYSSNVNAQVSLLDNLINKLENYRNFSYQSTNARQDLGTDTTREYRKELFQSAPMDKQFGYLFKLESGNKPSDLLAADLYNGKDVVLLNYEDSTFSSRKPPYFKYNLSLVGSLQFLKSLYDKRPFPIIMVADTVINGVINVHWIAKVSDTIENNEHFYNHRDLYIDKQTGLPSRLVSKGRYKSPVLKSVINDFYDETRYFDYKIDQPDVSSSSFAIPSGFHPPVRKTARPTLLAKGVIAPDWTLYDVNGNKLSLSQLKGKVVVLDFYFIGCEGCMLSLAPLNAIYETYKSKNVIMASLTERDSKKAVAAFEKNYKIKYPGYIGATDVVKAYHVTGFPTFYFINKEGKIASVFVGYDDDFEQKVTAAIDQLLSK